MLNIGEGHVSVCIPNARPPYRKHLMTLSRGATGRLKVEIESFRVGEQSPSRIEMGPLHKLARTLREKYNFTGEQMAQILHYLDCSARLIAEVAGDMKLEASAEVAPELETEAA